MFSHAFVKQIALAVVLSALFVGACSGRQGSGAVADVKAGNMPADGDWTGVYYSPVYGYLHLIAQGNSAAGKWRTADGSAWGEMHGTISGDLFKYEWVERKIGLVGPSATSSGRGYFKYTVPKEGESHEIVGQWGLKSDETGNNWKAVKQANMKPNPDSVMPDEVEGRTEAGGWDDQENKPKPPKAPEDEDKGGGGDEGGGGLE